MSAATRRRLVFSCLLLFSVSLSTSVFAQRRPRADIKIAEVKCDAVKTPDFKSSERSVKDHWGRFTVKFDVKKSGARTEWIDELEITWKILATAADGKAVLLSKSVNYEDVEEGSGHYACIYLKPKFIHRFMNTKRVVQTGYSVYVEMRIDGQKVESYVLTRPKHNQLGRWYRADSNRERSDRYLIAKSKSPFSAMDYDYYEAEKATE